MLPFYRARNNIPLRRTHPVSSSEIQIEGGKYRGGGSYSVNEGTAKQGRELQEKIRRDLPGSNKPRPKKSERMKTRNRRISNQSRLRRHRSGRDLAAPTVHCSLSAVVSAPVCFPILFRSAPLVRRRQSSPSSGAGLTFPSSASRGRCVCRPSLTMHPA